MDGTLVLKSVVKQKKIALIHSIVNPCHWSLSVPPENMTFGDAFRRYEKRHMTWNGLLNDSRKLPIALLAVSSYHNWHKKCFLPNWKYQRLRGYLYDSWEGISSRTRKWKRAEDYHNFLINSLLLLYESGDLFTASDRGIAGKLFSI